MSSSRVFVSCDGSNVGDAVFVPCPSERETRDGRLRRAVAFWHRLGCIECVVRHAPPLAIRPVSCVVPHPRSRDRGTDIDGRRFLKYGVCSVAEYARKRDILFSKDIEIPSVYK